MRAKEEYVSEHEEEAEEDVEQKVVELGQDQTEEEEVEEEAAKGPDLAQLELVRRVAVVEVVREMLAEQTIDVERLKVLTDQEREALEYLQAVVEGRSRGGKFMYAEDRLEQLNAVLADLQPLMAVGGMEGLDETLGQIVDGIDELRHKLELLEEAQEETRHEVEEKKKGKPDEDDDDKDDQPDEDAEAAPDEATAEPAATTPDGKPADGEKKPGLWGRLWNRGKKDEGGGGGA